MRKRYQIHYLASLIWSVLIMSAIAAPNLSRECLSPITAVPVASNLKIDGDLSEWDFTGSQVIYVSEEFYDHERAEFAFSYDDTALYFAAKVHDPSPMKNIHHASGRFWEGDSIQLRLYTKLNSKSVPQRVKGPQSQDKQLVHANFYYQHPENKTWTFFNYSIDFIDSTFAPKGVDVAYQLWPDHKGYNIEVKMPWSQLYLDKAPKAGETIHALVEVNYSDFTGQKRIRRTSGCYQKNPGDFGFLGGNNWGVLKFADCKLAKREYPTPEELSSSFKKSAGLSIPVIFKKSALATINIKNHKGEIVREIVLDKEQPAGTYEFIWNGKDNAGQDAPLGKYSYDVLFYDKVTANYQGSTGSSGTPQYGTLDGTGEWGGDHSNPLAVSTDPKGMTLLWPVAELGKAIVRMDDNDKVLWRQTPFFDAAGNFYTMTSDGDYVYLTYETSKKKPFVLRLNGQDGTPAFFVEDTKAVELPVGDVQRVHVPADRKATAFDLIASGMAVDNQNLYISIHPKNEVLVLNKKNAEFVRKIEIPFPRGIACDMKGNIFVVSAPPKSGGAIHKILPTGKVIKMISQGLDAPWNIAIKKNGNIVVSDLGDSQQVKEFDAKGQFVKTYGKQGGRPTSGRYVAGNYLTPSGVATDKADNIIVVESSLPSVISRIKDSGKIEKQWFGPGCYAHAVWPDAKDPFQIYTYVHGGWLRSRLNPETKEWSPETYWSFTDTRSKQKMAGGSMGDGHGLTYDYFKGPYFQNFTGSISYPQTIMFNGHQYMSSDSAEHPIARVEGDELIPIACCFAKDGKIYLGHDTNQNGVIDEDEIEHLKNLPSKPGEKWNKLINGHTGSHTLSPHSGNWFIAAQNKIYKIPLKATDNGRLRFDAEKAIVFIEDVTDSERKTLFSTHRQGILGMREDSKGNLYVLYTFPGKSPGIGHSSDITRVFLAKFDKTGERQWTAGKKAESFAKPGEVYNPWIMAGMIGDDFVAFSDECGGMIHFYDKDGFYRGKIFKDYARGDSAPGPYLFHGENFSGRVQYFPDLDKAYAYQGMTDSRVFELTGLKGKTSKASGNIALTQRYSQHQQKKGELALISKTKKLPVNLLDESFWAPEKAIAIQKDDKKIATLKMTIDQTSLAFYFDVNDKTSLRNSAGSPSLAFKGGDAVDLYFGNAEPANRKNPVRGDIRILSTLVKGKPTMIAMRPISDEKKKESFTNPAGYVRHFDYVGAIPGSELKYEKTPSGYIIAGRIPLAFLKPLSFSDDAKLAFDADVLESDTAGQKTLSRTFWHSSGDSRVTMTQDVPTECWLYPEFWGKAQIK